MIFLKLELLVKKLLVNSFIILKKFWKMNIIDDLQNNEPRRRIFNER